MRKLLMLLAVAGFLAGCGGGVPACDDGEVIKLLKKIFQDNGAKLIKVSAISTTSKDGNTCYCTGLGKAEIFGESIEDEISYKVTLSDNGKEFYVQIQN